MTHGDSECVKCPACKCRITDPLAGEKPPRGTILEKVIQCHSCGKRIYVWARWMITVQAERESKVK